MPATSRFSVVRLYYLSTPLFWFLDSAVGLHWRVAFIDDFAVGRNLYYLSCCAIGVATLRAPRYAGMLAYVESCANIVLIILSVGVWYLGALEQAESASTIVAAPSSTQLAGLVLAAAMAAASYQLRLTAAAQDVARGAPGR